MKGLEAIAVLDIARARILALAPANDILAAGGSAKVEGPVEGVGVAVRRRTLMRTNAAARASRATFLITIFFDCCEKHDIKSKLRGAFWLGRANREG